MLILQVKINLLNFLSVNNLSVLTASADILDHVQIGKNIYEQFVENRIKDSTPLWEKMKKRNLKTFQAQSKVVRCKLNDKIIKIKEQRSLKRRSLIMSRQRKEIDLKRIIGCYELSVIPPAFFLQDGTPHPCLDKPKVTPLHNLQLTSISINFLIQKVFMDLLIFHRFRDKAVHKEKR